MKSRPPRAAAFTLVELLVAMAIVAVLLVVTAGITGTARDSVRWAEKKIAADTGTRQFAGLLERDLREMIRRPDAPFEFKSLPGNDSLAFLATRAGYSRDGTDPGRSVSLVRHETGEGQAPIRGSLALRFEGDDTPTLDPDSTLPEIPEENRQVLSDTIFRIEIEFLVEESGGIVRRQSPPATLAPLRGIVATLAALDPTSRNLLPDGGLATLAGFFEDAAANESTLAAWTATLRRHGDRGGSGIPADAFRAIRASEQTFLFD